MMQPEVRALLELVQMHKDPHGLWLKAEQLLEKERKVKECRNCDYPKVSAHHGRYTWQHTFEPVLEAVPLTLEKEKK